MLNFPVIWIFIPRDFKGNGDYLIGLRAISNPCITALLAETAIKMAPSGWTLKKDGTKVVPLEDEIPHFVWHSSLCWMISINSNVPKIIKLENSRHWIIYNRFKKYLQTSKLVADHITFSGAKNNKIVSDKSVARYLSWWWNRGYLTWTFKIIVCCCYFGNLGRTIKNFEFLSKHTTYLVPMKEWLLRKLRLSVYVDSVDEVGSLQSMRTRHNFQPWNRLGID